MSSPRLVNQRYRLDAVLGTGGGGRSHRAVDVTSDTPHPVCVKFLATEGRDAAQRMRAEARLLLGIRHAHIRRAFDVGVDQETGELFSVSEYVDGVDLVQASSDAPRKQVLSWAAHICRALHHLHARGVVHNDLKPENVLIAAEDRRAILIDFGMFGLTGFEPGATLRGTARYLAPERIRSGRVEPASDLYALGVLLYRVTVGRFPFEADDSRALLQQHLHDAPDPPAQHGVPESLSRLILRLLAKEPARRMPDAASVLRALGTITGTPIALAAPPVGPRPALEGELVGRHDELTTLRDALAPPVPGRKVLPVWALTGGVGVGKSRLLAEVRLAARLRDVRWRQTSCRRGRPDPLAPVRALAVSDRDGRRAESLDRWAGAVVREACERPVVLAFDDLQRADPAVLGWLDRVAARYDAWVRSRGVRPALAVVVSIRTDEEHPWSAELSSALERWRARPIELGPIPARVWRDTLREALGSQPRLDELVDDVVRRSGGVPLFVLERLRHLADRGTLRFEEPQWRIEPGWKGDLERPDRASSVARSRIAEAEDPAALLPWLALLDRPATLDQLAELSETDEASCSARVAALSRDGLAVARREGGVLGYELAHPLYGDLLRDELTEETRRALHGRLADHLRGRGGSTVRAQARIAHHLLEAGRFEEAIVPAERALTQARRRRDAGAERVWLERLLAAAPAEAPERLRWSVALARRHERSGSARHARRTWRRVLVESRGRQDAFDEAMAWRSLSQLAWRQGRVRSARVMAHHVLRSTSPVARDAHAKASLCVAEVERVGGEVQPALARVDAVLASPTGLDPSTVAHAFDLRARWVTGDGAVEALTRARRAFREARDVDGELDVTIRLGWAAMARDDERSLLEHARAARRLARRLGHRSLLGRAEVLLAFAFLGQERFRAAFRHSRAGYEIAQESGDLPERADSAVQLAGAHFCIGEGDVSLRFLLEALRLRHALGAVPAGRVRQAVGRALISMGEHGRAVRSLRATRRLATRLGDPLLEVESRCFLARALIEASEAGAAEAETLSRDALTHAPAVPGGEAMALAEETRARVFVARGVESEAAALFERAIQRLRGRRFHSYDGLEPACLAYATLLADSEPARARELALEARQGLLEKVRRGGRSAWLAEADALLARVGAGDDSEGRALSRKARLLLGVTRLLNSQLKSAPLLERILDVALEVLDAQRGLLLMERDGRPELRVARRRGDVNDEPDDDGRFSRSVAERVLRTGEPVRLIDPQAAASVTHESVLDMGLEALVAVPLRSGGEVVGVLCLDDRRRAVAFTDEDLEILGVIADQAGLALQNASLVEKLLERQGALERARRSIEGLNERLEARVHAQSHTIETMSEELGRVRDALQERGERAVVAESAAMQRVLETVDRLAVSDIPVYVVGESGTGKDLVARRLHERGNRAAGPYVSLNCAAVPDSLLETELMGAEKGAYTGIDRARPGLFEQAHGGTLFLDEVAEMSPAMQVKLLRILEDGDVRRVGGAETRRVDVRLICASNRDLKSLAASGEMRQDLFYRLHVFRLELPSLRERPEDVPPLVERFTRKHTPDGAPLPTWTPAAMRCLLEHPWPGNVRELENEVRRALLSGERRMTRARLSPSLRDGITPPSLATADALPEGTLRDATERLERQLIEEALRRHRHNRTRAAAELGIPKSSLYNKLKRYGMDDV